MSRWTAEEIRELVTLWPTSTAAQIPYRLHRPRDAICGKAKRLLEEGLLEGKYAKNPNPRKRRRRARPLRIWIMLPPPPPPVNDSLAMRPCSLLELDEARCHWPLGDVNEVAALRHRVIAIAGTICEWRMVRAAMRDMLRDIDALISAAAIHYCQNGHIQIASFP